MIQKTEINYSSNCLNEVGDSGSSPASHENYQLTVLK